MGSSQPLRIGLPRVRNERAERRDFPPGLVRAAAAAGAEVFLETGYGDGIGFDEADYTSIGTSVHVVERAQVYENDVVLVLRPSTDSFELLRPGTTFVAMLHFPTHRDRARRLAQLAIHAIALDLIVDDEGLRLIEDMRAVAWNGLEAAFEVLVRMQRNFWNPRRAPTRVMVIGAGMVGKQAVEAATELGSFSFSDRAMSEGLPGVEVTTIGRNLSSDEAYMRWRLRQSDVVVDASRRPDPSRPIVPNEWLAELPQHSVIVDLAVDQYLLDEDPPVVRGIEGIPSGNLDRYAFPPSDPAWEQLPPGISTHNRRWVVSCYGWPGIKPLASSTHYARQIEPLLIELIRRGGGAALRADGAAMERALYRGSLRCWMDRNPADSSSG